MSLLWAVPVVAAVAAAILVAAQARALEDAAVELAHEVRRLRALGPRLGAVQRVLAESETRAAEFRRRHPLAPVDGDRHP